VEGFREIFALIILTLTIFLSLDRDIYKYNIQFMIKYQLFIGHKSSLR